MVSLFCATSHFWEATTAKRMKIDPHYKAVARLPMRWLGFLVFEVVISLYE